MLGGASVGLSAVVEMCNQVDLGVREAEFLHHGAMLG